MNKFIKTLYVLIMTIVLAIGLEYISEQKELLGEVVLALCCNQGQCHQASCNQQSFISTGCDDAETGIPCWDCMKRHRAGSVCNNNYPNHYCVQTDGSKLYTCLPTNAASVSGPTGLVENATGTFTADIGGTIVGIENELSYVWEKRALCSSGSGYAPCGNWETISTASSVQTSGQGDAFGIKVTVNDNGCFAGTRSSTSNEHVVTLSPQSLAININGPAYVQPNVYASYTASATGGSGSYTDYEWHRKFYDPNPNWVHLSTFDGQSSISVHTATYHFDLKCIVTDSDNDTAEDLYSIENAGAGGPLPKAAQLTTNIPNEIILMDNYPNPFNPSTVISYSLHKAQHVELTIYSFVGHKVAILVNGRQQAGFHEVHWNAHDQGGNLVPSGIYIYELKTDITKLTKKMLLIK